MIRFDAAFKALYKNLELHKISRSNVLFNRFLAYGRTDINPELSKYAAVLETARQAAVSEKIPKPEMRVYTDLIRKSVDSINTMYNLIDEAFRLYNLAVDIKKNDADMKRVNSLIIDAEIKNRDAMASIDEIKKINKKYDIK